MEPTPTEASETADARDFRRTVFGPRSRPLVFAIAVALMTDPAHPEASSAARFEWVVDEADDYIGHASKQLATGLMLALWALEWLPIVIVGRFARASSLSPADRVAYFARLEAHPIALFSLLVVAWKTILTILWFEHPDNAPVLGDDGIHARYLNVRPGLRAPSTHVPFRALQGGALVSAKPARTDAKSFVSAS
jgi:hypothetical protein